MIPESDKFRERAYQGFAIADRMEKAPSPVYLALDNVETGLHYEVLPEDAGRKGVVAYYPFHKSTSEPTPSIGAENQADGASLEPISAAIPEWLKFVPEDAVVKLDSAISVLNSVYLYSKRIAIRDQVLQSREDLIDMKHKLLANFPASAPAGVPDGWQPIETAPYGVFVLAWVFLPKNPAASACAIASLCYVEKDEPEEYGEARMTVGCWWANGRYYRANDDRGYITHWMPLPAAPAPQDSPAQGE